jgi:hypothetical protein
MGLGPTVQGKMWVMTRDHFMSPYKIDFDKCFASPGSTFSTKHLCSCCLLKQCIPLQQTDIESLSLFEELEYEASSGFSIHNTFLVVLHDFT